MQLVYVHGICAGDVASLFAPNGIIAMVVDVAELARGSSGDVTRA